MPSRAVFLKLAADCRAAKARLTAEYTSTMAKLDEQETTLLRLAERAGDEGIPGDADMNEVLTNRSPGVKVNVNQMMTAKHRAAISEGRSYKTPFQRACLKAGATQGAVARAAGVTPAFLSMCVRGSKAAPLKLRAKAHALVGWPLDDWKKLAD